MIPPTLPPGEAPLADAVVDAVREPLVILDGTLRVQRANRAFYRVFHATPAQTERRLLCELGNRQWDQPRLLQLLDDVIARNESFEDFEVTHDFPVIGQRVTKLNARRIDALAGRPALILLAIVDLTEFRQKEQRLHQLQQLEALGRLAGGIAHDFNNLLTVLSGRTEILQRRLGRHESALRDVRLIRDTTQRAARLTGQLLAFSRQQVLAPRVLDPQHAIRELQPMLRRLIPANIELIITLRSTSNVRLDLSQLEQVIINLVANARDAMPSGGRLRIETAEVELDAAFVRAHVGTTVGAAVTLTVADTGEGMTPDVRDRIFQPFFTTKTATKGTGLGLATVFSVVQQSGGSIWVDSEPGRGTTFTIYFPPAREPAEVVSSEPAPANLRGTETILLVEDEPEVRQTMSEMLSEYGYTVVGAGTASDAIAEATARGGGIDLLLTDVVMPAMSGPELATEIKRRVPGLRVIYTSGYSDRALLDRLVSDRTTPYLQKPFAPEDLARRVRAVLDAGR